LGKEWTRKKYRQAEEIPFSWRRDLLHSRWSSIMQDQYVYDADGKEFLDFSGAS